ncbi:ankyrin repeat domain-containing protein [Thiomicrospira microaerophila]|uniref:ankyrin repeat domain-containing protein n=1 Tax=Thiomicrospira microaerophila TaxID=406020 RepID=UPI0005C98052|nr:ankyrin repeat domain-containing protein [Thiomicrospira microaerophila]
MERLAIVISTNPPKNTRHLGLWPSRPLLPLCPSRALNLNLSLKQLLSLTLALILTLALSVFSSLPAQAEWPQVNWSEQRTLDYHLQRFAFIGEKHLVQQALEQGAQVDAQEGEQMSALLWAAQQNHPAIVALLLAKGANPYQQQPNGRHAMELAIEQNSQPLIDALLAGGFDVNHRADIGQETPLLIALRYGRLPLAYHLIERGAQPDAMDSLGRSVLSEAIRLKDPQLAALAIEAGTPVKRWLSAGIFNPSNPQPARPGSREAGKGVATYLHYAARLGQVEIMAQLLQAGVHRDLLTHTDQLNLDAVGLAAFHGHDAALDWLLTQGANPYRYYINRHPQGSRGIYYIGGGHSGYTLLSLATSALIQGGPRASIDRLLALAQAQDYAKLETPAFFGNLLYWPLNDAPNASYYQTLIERLEAWGFAQAQAVRQAEANDLKNQRDYHQQKQQQEAEEFANRTPRSRAIDYIRAGDLAGLESLHSPDQPLMTILPSAFFWVISQQQPQLILPLIELGFNAKQYTIGNQTGPLLPELLADWRQNRGFYDVFFTLVEQGQDINQYDVNGHTPLLRYLQTHPEHDEALLKRLVEKGARIHSKNDALYQFLATARRPAMIAQHPILKSQVNTLFKQANLTDTALKLLADKARGGRTTRHPEAMAQLIHWHWKHNQTQNPDQPQTPDQTLDLARLFAQAQQDGCRTTQRLAWFYRPHAGWERPVEPAH